MIGAQIKIADIDYQKTFQNVFPKALGKWKEMKNPNLMIRFLQKMGDASMTAALGILELLSEEDKGALLCEISNLYGQEIRIMLNHYLARDDLGKNIRVGELMMQQDGGKMILSVRDVEIDYNRLLQNESVQDKIGNLAGQVAARLSGNSRLKQLAADGANLAARAAVRLAPDEVEKKAITVIRKENYRSRLLEIAQQVLENKGIYLTLADIALLRETGVVDIEGEVDTEGNRNKIAAECSSRFPKELEEALLDAVSAYLKQMLGECQRV